MDVSNIICCENTYDAAKKGHLKCLITFHHMGFPWDEKTLSIAVQNNNSRCVIYLREYGCPWDEKTEELASRNNLLLINGSPNKGLSLKDILSFLDDKDIISSDDIKFLEEMKHL